jgi:hypothetical protein
MKIMKDFKVRLYLLAGIVLFGFSGSALATAFGPLNIANCSGGGVTFTATTITWSPAGTVAGTGCVDTGLGTNVTYSGGTLLAGDAGNIKNLTSGGGAVDQFMTYQGTTLDFVLIALGPGVANTVCTGLFVGGTCSVFAGSPFVLTNLGGGSTSVGLHASGTVTDGGVTSSWFGAFSTQLNLTPDQIQTAINAGGSVSTTHSAQFTVASATVIPEPGTTLLFLLGGGALIGLRCVRKSS